MADCYRDQGGVGSVWPPQLRERIAAIRRVGKGTGEGVWEGGGG